MAPVTGLFFISGPPNPPPNAPSPSSILISHISRKFPSQPLPPFALDQRLLNDTISFLPGTTPAQRRHTQFLSLSHLSGKTYIGTRSATQDGVVPSSPVSTSVISIPNSAAESFYETVTKKMQSLWAHRQSLHLTNGTAMDLKQGDWVVRIGDLKTRNRQGQDVVRGVLLELQFHGSQDEDDDDDVDGAADMEKEQLKWNSQEQMLRAFFEATTRGSGVSMDNLRVVVKVPGVKKTEPESWILVRQYMELLRFGRNA